MLELDSRIPRVRISSQSLPVSASINASSDQVKILNRYPQSALIKVCYSWLVKPFASRGQYYYAANTPFPNTEVSVLGRIPFPNTEVSVLGRVSFPNTEVSVLGRVSFPNTGVSVLGRIPFPRHRSVSTWTHTLSQHRSVSTWTYTLSQHRSVSTGMQHHKFQIMSLDSLPRIGVRIRTAFPNTEVSVPGRSTFITVQKETLQDVAVNTLTGYSYRIHWMSVLQESGDSTQHITSVKPVNDRDRLDTDTLSQHRSVSTWRHSLSQHRSVSTWTRTLSQHRSVSTWTCTLSQHRSVSTQAPKCQYTDTLSQHRSVSTGMQHHISQIMSLGSLPWIGVRMQHPFPTPKCQYRRSAPSSQSKKRLYRMWRSTR